VVALPVIQRSDPVRTGHTARSPERAGAHERIGMQALKALVAGLGILIIVGVGVIGWGLYRKATDPQFSFFGPAPAPQSGVPAVAGPGDTAPPAAPAPSAAAVPFGAAVLGLADGCTIADIRPDGKRLYVLVDPAAGCPRIVAVDADSGRVLGTFTERR
jgi:hypothetical protein